MSPTGHAIGGPGGTTGFPKRLAFAHLLRGVAALSVLASHYLDMFWTEPAVIASLLGVPAAASRQPPGWYPRRSRRCRSP